VDAVAAETIYAGLRMRRTQEVRMCVRVAAEAGLVDLGGRQLREALDLGDITTTLYVRLAWSVAALAASARSAMLERQLRVRIVHHCVCVLLVARRAGLAAYISRRGRCCRRRRGLLQSLGLRLRLRGRHARAAGGQYPDHCNQKEVLRYLAGQMSHTVTPLLAR